jgi:hypothetical protein
MLGTAFDFPNIDSQFAQMRSQPFDHLFDPFFAIDTTFGDEGLNVTIRLRFEVFET